MAFASDAMQQRGTLAQYVPAAVKMGQPGEMRSFKCGGWWHGLKNDGQAERFRPVNPFRTVDGGEWLDGDPGYAERVGDDDPVQCLAHQGAALADSGDDRQRIVARIDQRDACRGGDI